MKAAHRFLSAIALSLFLLPSSAFATFGAVHHAGEITNIEVTARGQHWHIACFTVVLSPGNQSAIPPQGTIAGVHLYMPTSGWKPASGVTVSQEPTQNALRISKQVRFYAYNSPQKACFTIQATNQTGRKAIQKMKVYGAALATYHLRIMSMNTRMLILDFHPGGWVNPPSTAKGAAKQGIKKVRRAPRKRPVAKG